VIVVNGAKSVFALSANDRTVSIDEHLMYGLTFTAEERL
jgi:hypothetical protein